MDVIWTILSWIGYCVGAIVALIIILLWNPWPARRYLMSYRPADTSGFTALNATSTEYILKFKIVSPIWGTRSVERVQEIPYHESFQAYFAHWDKLIETQQQIKR